MLTIHFCGRRRHNSTGNARPRAADGQPIGINVLDQRLLDLCTETTACLVLAAADDTKAEGDPMLQSTVGERVAQIASD